MYTAINIMAAVPVDVVKRPPQTSVVCVSDILSPGERKSLVKMCTLNAEVHHPDVTLPPCSEIHSPSGGAGFALLFSTLLGHGATLEYSVHVDAWKKALASTYVLKSVVLCLPIGDVLGFEVVHGEAPVDTMFERGDTISAAPLKEAHTQCTTFIERILVDRLHSDAVRFRLESKPPTIPLLLFHQKLPDALVKAWTSLDGCMKWRINSPVNGKADVDDMQPTRVWTHRLDPPVVPDPKKEAEWEAAQKDGLVI